MVTITLHDKDAQEVLAHINVALLHPEWGADTQRLLRAKSAFRCSLLICDCGGVKAEDKAEA